MKQRTVNTICLLLAVAGLSFGAGQTVGQDRAEAGATAARVQKVKDTAVATQLRRLYELQLDAQVDNYLRLGDVLRATRGTCLNVRYLAGPDTTNRRPCP